MKRILLFLAMMPAFFASAQLIPNKQLHITSNQYVNYSDTKIDNVGNVYAVGYAAAGSDIDPGPGVSLTASSNSTFISKYNSTTQTLEWVVTYTTSGSFNSIKGIAINSAGDVFVTGLFSNDMDVDPGMTTAFITSYQSSVLIKFSNAGIYNGFKQIVSNNSGGFGISIDANDAIYVSGFADGNVNFDPGASNFSLTSQGNDLFIASYNSSMNFNWAVLFGSVTHESAYGLDQIQFDATGNIYAAAKVAGTCTVAGTALTTNAECVIKLNSIGTLTDCWVFDVTAPYGNKYLSLQVQPNGKFYVSGGFYGTVDLDPTAGTLLQTAYTPGTASDQFVGLYQNNGAPVWLHTFSNYIGEVFFSSGTDAQKNIYLWGNYDPTTDYDKGAGVASFPYTNPIPEYAIISYDSLGNYRGGRTFMNGIDPNTRSLIQMLPSGNGLLFMGTGASWFGGGTVDYAPGPPVMTLPVTGNSNGIITTYDFCASAFQTSVTPSICSGATYTLPAGSVVSAAGTYTDHVVSYWGCDSIIYTSLVVNALPNVTAVSNASLICTGSTATLSAGGAGTYTWSTTENTSDIAVSPTVTTTYTLNGTDANGCSNAALITQSVSLCTGMNELNGLTVSVFPNPFAGNVTIKQDAVNALAEIKDVLGKTVLLIKLTAHEHTINLSHLSNGIYYLQLTDSSGIYQQKLIKE